MYQIMFYVGLGCSILFFILSCILFVRNNVAKLIGDVTGWNAKRAIKEINKKGAEEISKKEAIRPETSKVLIQNEEVTTGMLKKPEETEEEKTDVLASNAQLSQDEETDILNLEPEMDQETELLREEETELLAEEETDVLVESATEFLIQEEATDILYEEVNISQGGFDSILNGATDLTDRTEAENAFTEKLTTDVVIGTEDLTTVLKSNVQDGVYAPTDMLTGEEQPIPDIFEVEEDTMVVHTEDKI